ncbi:maleylpyruvate isomerase N-terminal domain-containing protein [Streptomyces sp. NPDC005805]|uniref:maleylpyruvate isomerase N-terminal domain-containing protein n=1 Tax=Streptomyces sp. NPDC005805 TaxID=3157068 RepID=UPI003405427D
MPSTGAAPSPVTAEDLDQAVRLSTGLLLSAPAGADWDAPAGSLEWDCRETAEHLADDLFAYAAQLGLRQAPVDREVPFVHGPRRPGGPANTVHADPAAGALGLVQVVEACGAMLSAMVRTAPGGVRGHHVFGASDAEGFAAMGIVETLVHTHDIADGLGLDWSPPDELCERVLARLFPDVPVDGGEPWPVLLWATGRGGLPGRPRRTSWRWYGAPRS